MSAGLGAFDRPENPAPQLLPGFEFLPGLLQSLGQRTQGQFGNIFGGAPGAGILNALIPLAAGQAFGGTGALQRGLNTGFFDPGAIGQVEQALTPGLERAFERGRANLLDEGAALGLLSSSTGTLDRLADLRTDLETNFIGRPIADITGRLATGAQNAQTQLASIIPGLTRGLVGEALGESRFSRQLPLGALGAISQGATSTPFFQPTFGPSKFEQATSGLGAIAGPAAQGATAGLTKGACWVAAAAYGGWDCPGVHLARDWVLHRAPRLVRALYLRFGERAAPAVARSRVLRSVVRRFFVRVAWSC